MLEELYGDDELASYKIAIVWLERKMLIIIEQRALSVWQWSNQGNKSNR